MSFGDLNLQNANKVTSIQDSFKTNSYLFLPPSNISYEIIDYSRFTFNIFQIDYL